MDSPKASNFEAYPSDLRGRAASIRERAIRMGAIHGQGYVGQALGLAVLHVPTIKPLDEFAILHEAGPIGRLGVAAENYSVIGEFGEAVAALLMRARGHPPCGRSRCRTSSSQPAPCRPCMTTTAFRRKLLRGD